MKHYPERVWHRFGIGAFVGVPRLEKAFCLAYLSAVNAIFVRRRKSVGLP